jgi:hypothetical protein
MGQFSHKQKVPYTHGSLDFVYCGFVHFVDAPGLLQTSEQVKFRQTARISIGVRFANLIHRKQGE